MTHLNGFYSVGNETFSSKIFAMLKASETKQELKWIFHDVVFDHASSHFTSSLSLLELYRLRAQQLRDKYDYLILNYSGGSDSHNILQVFLKNNIKLDHIYVQWPESLTDKGIYSPNSVDKTNANFHSEWDLVLKKDLEWLGKNHPEITIEIGDWTRNVKETFYKDDIFANDVSNLPSIARAQKQNTFSPIEGSLALNGKTVGSIFGVDKPNIVKKGHDWFYYFTDTACMTQPNPENPHGTEYFYWSPDCPEIAIKQAILMKEWFIANPTKQYLIQAKSERALLDPTFTSWPYEHHYAEYAQIAEIAKLVCYPYWDFSRFQADKPFAVLDGFKMGTRAWDNILTAIPEFNRIQQAWQYHWTSYLNKIDAKFMRSHDTVAVIKSRWHKIK
jgi:hypothetical protein